MVTYDQTFIEASDGAGNTKRFFYTPAAILSAGATGQTYDSAVQDATEYAQSAGGFGYVVLMGRNRLNDYVGAPIWSEPEVIREL